MKKTVLLLVIALIGLQGYSQTQINGRVTDEKGAPLAGANIMVKGTYDGDGTDANGYYSFVTYEKGKQLIVASFIGFELKEKEVEFSSAKVVVDFVMKEITNQIADVVISAGTFETSDRKKSVTLQPLDILTTPSAAGDIYGALTSLPGASMVGEDGRLFAF